MAIKIPRNTVADHVVFDRIVDADRTIKLAREAAAKAEAAGKQDIADKLNAKADALEKILLATQHPEYDDEEEPPENVGGGGNNQDSQNGGNQDPNDQENTDKQGGEDEELDDQSNGSSGGSGQENGQEESDHQGTDSDGVGKTPEDIANMDQHNGSHASGTKQIGDGGSSSSSQGSGSGGGQNSASNQSSSDQQNGKKGGQQELDPFKLQLGLGNGQQKPPTPEEILAAVIKRLKGLGGNAKAGADRALRKLFDELGGTGDIDD